MKTLKASCLILLGLAYVAVNADGQQAQKGKMDFPPTDVRAVKNDVGANLAAPDGSDKPAKPTIESLQNEIADLKTGIAQRDTAIKQLQAAAESWLKQFNGCMGELIMAKSAEKK